MKDRQDVVKKAEQNLADKKTVLSEAEKALLEVQGTETQAEIEAQQKKIDSAKAEYDKALLVLEKAKKQLDSLTTDYNAKVSVLEKAKAELDTAQNVLEEKKKAAEAAKKIQENGSKGFFESIGATSAANVFSKESNYKKYTQMGQAGDATSLQNMLRALDFIEEANKLRRMNGLEEYKISPYLMAVSQYQTNGSSNFIGHTKVFSVNENLAWGSSTPESAFNVWYYREKENMENGSGNYGHYSNIMRKNTTITGFSVCNKSGTLYGFCAGQVFWYPGYTNETTYYTVAEFRTLLNAYLESATKAESELASAQADYDAKLKVYQDAQNEVARCKALLLQYQNDKNASEAEVKSALETYKKAVSAAEDAKADLAEKKSAYNQAQQAVDSAQTAYDTAKKELLAKEADVKAKKEYLAKLNQQVDDRKKDMDAKRALAKEKADILEVKKAELDLAKKELLAKETALAQAQGKTAQLTVEKEALEKSSS